LIDEAHRIKAVDAELALAALREEGDAGQAGVELEGVAVAGRPPANLAGAAKDAAAELVAQGGGAGQQGSIGRRRRFAGASPVAIVAWTSRGGDRYMADYTPEQV